MILLSNRKRGSTLIEVVIAMTIILICASLVSKISFLSKKSASNRMEISGVERIAYAIENEIKYNISIDDLKDVEVMNYKYKKDILNELLFKSLLDLDKGEGIKIEKIKKEDRDDFFNIKITVKGDGEDILCVREFAKAYWMEK